MKISVIVAHGKNYELGLNNKLLWHIPGDLKNFKNLTRGHHILMGRKTFESIGTALPHRTSLVISSNFDTNLFNNTNNVFSFKNVNNGINFARENKENELFIIGGAKIYNEFEFTVDNYYITEVDYSCEADVYLKPINFDDYILTDFTIHPKTKTSPSWKFKKFVRKNDF